MKQVLILGAGLSSSSLVRYLLQHSEQENWHITVVDQTMELIESKTNKHANSTALVVDALKRDIRLPLIEKSDLVISMLPARFHIEVAQDCIATQTDLITPSYVSSEMKALDAAAKEAGIIIMNEIGVDPGIDHMSAMKIIHEIGEKGGELISFKSFCGGLIAPESDNNPLGYKFTWNPRNVVLAGQGGASCFIQQGEYKYIPYHRLFSRLENIEVNGYGSFEGYTNRDSLKYRGIYGLENIPTIYRGTLRRPGFCDFWNIMIQLGLTDDSYTIENSHLMTPRRFLNSFLPFNPNLSVEEKVCLFLQKSESAIYNKIKWLGFFNMDEPLGIPDATPAQLLQKILVGKLSLDPEDKDMLVMSHEFIYNYKGQKHQVFSQMVNIGEDSVYTSMSNTVGLPVAICAKMILKDQIEARGIQLPLTKEMYLPILEELESHGIQFNEKDTIID
ncbi:MAG: saccharopine dehydrogenase NADP-binding domain-containing protein [Bacteroidetes bacterium]|nr:saccharopine dehydrogenase NADP-binding domain-containing protein [Bacteroidota bacterium]